MVLKVLGLKSVFSVRISQHNDNDIPAARAKNMSKDPNSFAKAQKASLVGMWILRNFEQDLLNRPLDP